MKVLITGGSGFIGTRLTEDLLKKGHEVKIYDKAPSNKYPNLVTLGDVRDKNALVKALKGIDVIFNLAAEHADNVTPKSLYHDVNVKGAENIVAAAKANDIHHIVFTSSVAIYGLNRGEPDENTSAQPFNEYGKSKYEAEQVFLDWQKENSDYSLVIVRPSVIFGENNRGNVYNLIKQIASGKFVMIGKGDNKKSMGYVGNISAFLSTLTDYKSGVHVFNFADKPDLTSKEIVKIIKNELGIEGSTLSIPYWVGLMGGYAFDLLSMFSGKKFLVSSIRIKKFTASTTISTKNLEKIGFVRPYSLEEGLRKMIRNDFLNN